MQYTNMLLFVVGLLGILTHLLVKINGINRRTEGAFEIKPFLKIEWPAILLSIIAVTVGIIVKDEIKQLKDAGKWLGLGMYAGGYMAESLILALMGKYEKKINNL